jgi:heat shock protein HslJ
MLLWITVLAVAGCRLSSVPAGNGAAREASPPAQDSPLAGTDWRLVEFRSMSDAVGTVRPDDPSGYTMRLAADGTVAMRLNCNRATGTWTAEPAGDSTSGRFRFGRLAATRAHCPPPSMDEQVAAHAEYVRSYLIEDGRLYLGLLADGGVYVWEPDTSTSSKNRSSSENRSSSKKALAAGGRPGRPVTRPRRGPRRGRSKRRSPR